MQRRRQRRPARHHGLNRIAAALRLSLDGAKLASEAEAAGEAAIKILKIPKLSRYGHLASHIFIC